MNDFEVVITMLVIPAIFYTVLQTLKVNALFHRADSVKLTKGWYISMCIAFIIQGLFVMMMLS